MSKMVYLAEPIDQAGERQGELRRFAWETLAEADVTVYHPSRAFTPSDILAAREIHAVNQAALLNSSGLVAVLPPGVPTLGVPAEIEQALGMGLPVFILTRGSAESAHVQIAAWADRGAQIWIRPSDDVACQMVKKWGKALASAVFDADPGSLDEPIPYQVMSTHPAALPPTRSYDDDAGLDLYTSEATVIPAKGRGMVPVGVAGALPPRTWGLILGRSSTWANRGLMVIPSVIDAGWRGELFVGVWNPGSTAVSVSVGERIGQFVILPAWQGRVQEVQALPPHIRGLNGFGSSDRVAGEPSDPD